MGVQFCVSVVVMEGVGWGSRTMIVIFKAKHHDRDRPVRQLKGFQILVQVMLNIRVQNVEVSDLELTVLSLSRRGNLRVLLCV